jgi:hypothetical protein
MNINRGDDDGDDADYAYSHDDDDGDAMTMMTMIMVMTMRWRTCSETNLTTPTEGGFVVLLTMTGRYPVAKCNCHFV